MAIHLVCDVCQAEYDLKDEFAGRKVKCRNCQNVLQVPQPGEEPVLARFADRGDVHPAFQRDKFLVAQKRLSINEKYYVYDDAGGALMFVERPLHIARGIVAGCSAFFVLAVVVMGAIALGMVINDAANLRGGALPAVFGIVGFFVGLALFFIILLWLYPKRHITFYTDESKDEVLIEILQDFKFALVNATYTVLDHERRVLGRFRKNYLYNILRRRWYGYDAEGQDLLIAMEDSLILSLLRRFIGPLFGILRTNFIILKPDRDTLVGEFNRKFTLFDKYVLDLTADRAEYLDRRLALALGVLLDTGEHR